MRREREMTRVGLVKGSDRFGNVYQALVSAGDEVKRKLHGDVLIKINCVVGQGSMADTQPDALRAVLEFLKPLRGLRVRVGESRDDTLESLRRAGFLALADEYEVEFVDFNSLGCDEITLQALDGSPLVAPITRAYRSFDCLISLSVPKAHSDAVLTLSGKNVMGFLGAGEIWRIHGVREFGRDDNLAACTRTIHKNLRTLLSLVRPDVAVLDGFHSFEAGTVPQCAKGDLVEPHIALAGADFVAVDTVAATLFGFNPADIGYLSYCIEDRYGTGDLSQIEILGTPLAEACFPLKPAPRLEELVAWRD
jgi:uncharacterized protein (DUF362 family)